MGLEVLSHRCATGDALVRCPCKLLTECVRTRGRIMVGFSFTSETDPGGYRYLLSELHTALRGHVAVRHRSEERGSRNCVRACLRMLTDPYRYFCDHNSGPL